MRTRITRRDLLRLSAVLLAGCRARSEEKPAASSSAPQAPERRKARVDVVIIGAGVAGLGAAHDLRKEGKDVLVLEGRARIGGRLWTDRSWPGCALDLGASWIHGPKGNPLTALVKELEIETIATDGPMRLYDADGRPLTRGEERKVEERLTALLKVLERRRSAMQENGGADISLRAAFDQAIATLGLGPRELLELEHAINTTIEHEYAADVADLSFLHWDDDADNRGEDVVFRGGYDQIATALARGVKLELGQIVTRVEHDDSGVRVTTSKGSFEADRAIVTLPLGVLKAGVVAFAPALPEKKLAAIGRLGMGVLNKVYLRFPEPFWPAGAEVFGHIGTRRGEWAECLNVHKHSGKPVLLWFNAGDYGARIEAKSDEAIVREAMGVLRTMFGAKIPGAEAALVTRWIADPFARGSYSHRPPGASPADHEALAAPVGERLFFAGEATSRRNASTVHGALVSGRRAAREVLAV